MAKPQYQGKHPKLRAYLLRRLRPGIDTCPQVVNGIVCGQPMYVEQGLDLGHDDRGGWLGLVHARCNRQAGAIASNGGKVTRRLVRVPPSGRKWLPTWLLARVSKPGSTR